MNSIFMRMQPQTAALLTFITHAGDEFFDDCCEYKDGRYQIDVEITPWQNGREQGFVVSVSERHKNEWANVAFFEHRNSDSLCAVDWRGGSPYLNGFTVEDIPEANYKDKWDVESFDWLGLDRAQAFLRKVAKQHIMTSRESAA